MKDELLFYICPVCGNLVEVIHSSRVPMVCCGSPMKVLTANTKEAATEKHIPVFTLDGTTLTVNVGSIAHPMTPEHYIEWIYVNTSKGAMRQSLTPSDEPCATFSLMPDTKILEVYAYCNLHGLWKTEL